MESVTVTMEQLQLSEEKLKTLHLKPPLVEGTEHDRCHNTTQATYPNDTGASQGMNKDCGKSKTTESPANKIHDNSIKTTEDGIVCKKKNKNEDLRKSRSPTDMDKQNFSKSPHPVPFLKKSKILLHTQESVPDIDGDAGASCAKILTNKRETNTENTRYKEYNNQTGQTTSSYQLNVPCHDPITRSSTFQPQGMSPYASLTPVFIVPKYKTPSPQPMFGNRVVHPLQYFPSTTASSGQRPRQTFAQSRQSQGTAMADFVLLHTDVDQEEACDFREHLFNDIDVSDLTVDLFSNIDSGQSAIQSLDTLHDRYHHILTFVTENLVADYYTRFLNEILLTFGLKEGNGKEDRIIPIWTSSGSQKLVLELSIIRGVDYHKFKSSNNPTVKSLYKECIKKMIMKGRQRSR